jgi:hypothetical protein
LKWAQDNEQMQHPLFSSITLSLLTLLACNRDDLTVENEVRRPLSGVPSASGIASIGDAYYVVGDNAPFLYQLNAAFEVTAQWRIFDWSEDGVIPKKIKPDFEAIAAREIDNSHQLFIFGSGSKSPVRDRLTIFDLRDTTNIQHFDLTAFYNDLVNLTPITRDALNIEAAEIHGNKLWLFNRGVNIILQYDLTDFLACIEHGAPCEPPTWFDVELPEIEGITAGFSGATYLADRQQMLFTASVEDTDNPIDDGQIKGSFLGLIDLADLTQGYRPPCTLLGHEHGTLPLKVESVTLHAQAESGRIRLVLVTDSDGGVSEVIVLSFHF